jgi:hypothetical protein
MGFDYHRVSCPKFSKQKACEKLVEEEGIDVE